MFETLVFIALALAAAAGGLVAYASRKPDMFSVERTVDIAAQPAQIYPHIASLRRMNVWNPFVAPDPAIRLNYSGPDSGVGAAHTWVGNRNVGAGRIEIVEVHEPKRLVMQLDMERPMTAHNTVVFTLDPQGDATRVTWAMSGAQPLMAKVMATLIDCDRMVGSRFEKGLGDLKSLIEKVR